MQLRGARILMTGGAGFIGSHFVRDLCSAGAAVTVFDNFSTGSDENLDGVDGDVTVVRGDILDYEALRDTARGHDGISHQAAQLEITTSIGNPEFDLTTNTIGTLNVLRAATELGITKVVEASSAGVYGQAVTDLQDETHPTDPNWEYGVSKLACEKYAAIACERNQDLAVASLRYAIVFGEREWYGRVLTLFLKRALEGRSPVVFGRGDQVRDFVYVGDIARLHRSCFETDVPGHVVLNGSTAVGTSVLELANTICEVVGERLEPIFDDVAEGQISEMAGGRMRLPSELQAMRMSYARAKTLLGWEPQVSLRDGLEREWTWLQAHPHRWNEMSY
jgi:UDP-glucose 4-epimerase